MALNEKTRFLAVARDNNSIEIFKTNSWAILT